ncbi:hypothetical protein DPM19_15810 [Actinomadura craniellae]|uniref:Glycosyltransferase RgtA/B/C/D-like domain-containing protein n=1 Tax=Actinomadura craniellae TaxID=2231787 RepID=A0A365H600_9ACTN|nr:hypothetical protein [Actinomadura craniellae]RAY14422.1 hypothetical protein DPM19_15810 [Actinomadura craniellae]
MTTSGTERAGERGALVPARPPAAAPASPGRSRQVAYWLAAGWAAQVAVRLWLAKDQAAPHFYPDEVGYLMGARLLAGGPGADLSGMTFYQGGYSLLLTPAFWLSDDPAVVYGLVVKIGALVGSLGFLLGYALLVRCGVQRVHAGPLAWAAALVPFAVVYNQGALADAVLPVLVLGWLLALDALLRRHSVPMGVLAGAAAAHAYTAHARGAVLVVVHLAVVGGYLLRGRHRRVAAIALAAALAAAAAAVGFNAWMSARLYPGGSHDLNTVFWDRMTSLDGQLRAVSGAVGQLWAIIGGTWGLGGVGLVALVVVLVRRSAPGVDRVLAGAFLAVVAGMGYASAAALPDELRVGNFAYGRYLAPVALTCLLLGVAALARGRRTVPLAVAAAAVFVGSALWVWLYAGDLLRRYLYIPHDFAEIGLIGASWTKLNIAPACLTGCVLLAVLVAARRIGFQALFAVLLLVNLSASLVITMVHWRPRAQPVPEIPGAPGGRVAADRYFYEERDDGQPQLISARLAYRVWWTELEWFDPEQGPPPGVCTVVVKWPVGGFAADSWPAHPPGWQYRRAQSFGVFWVVWHAPACSPSGG